MKIIPLILFVTGGVMIYAGMNGDNPLTVLKGVLTGGYSPSKTPSWNSLGNTAAQAGQVAASGSNLQTNTWSKLGTSAASAGLIGVGR